MIDDELPRNRILATAAGSKLFFNGNPCRRGHVAPRQTRDSWCMTCKAENAEVRRQRDAAYKRRRREDPEFRAKEQEFNRNWLAKPGNRELTYARNAEVHRRRLAVDPEYREMNREYQRRHRQTEGYAQTRQEWLEANRHKTAEYASKRRAQLLEATPPWLTEAMRAEMQCQFEEAARLSNEGELHEVDHIIPLISETVCGLHVPWNLRATDMVSNRSKANRLPPSSDWLAPTDWNRSVVYPIEFDNDNTLLWFAAAV